MGFPVVRGGPMAGQNSLRSICCIRETEAGWLPESNILMMFACVDVLLLAP